MYLTSDQAEVSITLAYEAQNQTVDGLGHIQCPIMLDKQSLQFVIIKGFVAELDVLMANVSQDRSLWVQIVILARATNDTALNVAEQTR